MRVKVWEDMCVHLVELYHWVHGGDGGEYGRQDKGWLLRWRGKWIFAPAYCRLVKLPFTRLVLCVGGPFGFWPVKWTALGSYGSPQLVPMGTRSDYERFDGELDNLAQQEPWTELRLWPAPKWGEDNWPLDFVDFRASRARIMRAA